jgi:hypothetical protein
VIVGLSGVTTKENVTLLAAVTQDARGIRLGGIVRQGDIFAL